ncbi:cytochrome c oxidase assembly protein [Biformimicrobium ophioploci]|uniref:Cytochrome c oxidase assembly protein CtaG n=1 Tax=Biformimicrobium ophioploci TaxID=3036711 RepID=A0ABQ6LV98_9GAMM|nr:cytochrome c oxidase assembly protein [Microbulbifer sp. NKW57]GMG86010.1 cytochrome c oxidase assembly protein [Microbulbifer sp. NKW57]
MSTQQRQTANARTLARNLATVVGMFLFAIFVMPPLYDAFCEITGLNGKTGGRYEAVPAAVDTSRTVKVQFVATNNENMPWEFAPGVREIVVHPGEQVDVHFVAVNPTGRDMVAQAIPSLVPFKAAEYFHKTECFCFNQQALAAGERTDMPLQFIVDQDLPKSVNTITLSYTIFDVTEMYDGKLAKLSDESANTITKSFYEG